MSTTVESMQAEAEQFRDRYNAIREMIGRVIVGHDDIVHGVLTAILCGGHCLLEGVPGLGKTMLVRTLARVLDLDFNRIQFTPDLMPADITGTEILEESTDGHRRLQFVRGPIFANVILADEINRTPPKTQAALLEAMQEHQVTAAGIRYPLDEPFFVLATQNPIEMEGTYPLPEAQLDRFMFNVVIDYLPEDQEVDVVTQTTSRHPEPIEPIFTSDDVMRFHEIVRRVPVAREMVHYAVRLAAASRPGQVETPDFIDEWVSWGAGLRAGQYLILGSKARALLHGRSHVSPDDIRALAHATLRHRTLLGYRAEVEGVTVDDVIDRLLKHVAVPSS